MKHSAEKRKRIPISGEILCSLLTVSLAMSCSDQVFSGEEGSFLSALLAATLLCMAGIWLFRGFLLRPKGKPVFVYMLFCSAVYLGCAVLFMFSSDVGFAVQIASGCYWFTLLAGRVLSIVRRHRLRNVLLNLLLIVLILIYGYAAVSGQKELNITMFIVAMQALYFLMEVAFARIRIDILRKIIRKTYAAEIIYGLGILIIAFSYVFMHTEESMPTLTDALWYCFAIVTTIGFGDITATSLIGRALSVVLGIYGIIVVALITSIIVNFYGEMKKTGDGDDEEDEDLIEEKTEETTEKKEDQA